MLKLTVAVSAVVLAASVALADPPKYPCDQGWFHNYSSCTTNNASCQEIRGTCGISCNAPGQCTDTNPNCKVYQTIGSTKLCRNNCDNVMKAVDCWGTTGCMWIGSKCTAMCQSTYFTTQGDCNAQTGCTWYSSAASPVSAPAQCVADCSQANGYDSCAIFAGCFWDFQTQTCHRSCSGTKQSKQADCNAVPQCEWVANGETTGTCYHKCTGTSWKNCVVQPGCIYQMGQCVRTCGALPVTRASVTADWDLSKCLGNSFCNATQSTSMRTCAAQFCDKATNKDLCLGLGSCYWLNNKCTADCSQNASFGIACNQMVGTTPLCEYKGSGMFKYCAPSGYGNWTQFGKDACVGQRGGLWINNQCVQPCSGQSKSTCDTLSHCMYRETSDSTSSFVGCYLPRCDWTTIENCNAATHGGDNFQACEWRNNMCYSKQCGSVKGTVACAALPGCMFLNTSLAFGGCMPQCKGFNSDQCGSGQGVCLWDRDACSCTVMCEYRPQDSCAGSYLGLDKSICGINSVFGVCSLPKNWDMETDCNIFGGVIGAAIGGAIGGIVFIGLLVGLYFYCKNKAGGATGTTGNTQYFQASQQGVQGNTV